jgi:exonuclease SbcC
MYVTKVALEDIKSYEAKTTVHLGQGVTAIIGENGAGKSTIAEAIGFALFDSLPDSVAQKDFVRRGESTGTVWVTFVTQEGEIYTVERDASGPTYAVIDEDAGAELELDTKSEVVDWLRTTLGVAGSNITLSDLWEHCIGVPQTRFLGDFRKTERNRKRDFDPLLGIDIYEQAWGRSDGPNLKAPVDELKARKRTAAQRIATLDAQAADLPDARDDVEGAETAVHDHEAELATIYDSLGDARVNYAALHAQKARIDDLEADQQQAQQDVSEARSTVRSAVEKLEEAREAADVLKKTAESHRRWEEADDRLGELRANDRERKQLAEQQSDRKTELVKAQSAYDQAVEQAAEAEEAKETMEALEDAYERYEALDDLISEVEENVDRLAEARERHAELVDEEIPKAEVAVEEQQATITELEEKQDIADQVEGLQAQRDELVATHKQAQAKVEDLEEQRERLLDVDVGGNGDSASEHDGNGSAEEDAHNHADDAVRAACPTCQRPMDEDLRDEVVETIDDQITAQTRRHNGARRTLQSVESDLQEAKEAQQAVSRLPSERRELERLEDNLEELEAERDTLADEIDDLAGADDRLDDLRKEQAKLESDHEAYKNAQVTHRTNKGAIDAVDDKLDALVDAAHELALVERELQAYEGLDDKIDAQEAIKRETADAHRKYIQHEDLAGRVDQRRDALLDAYDEVEIAERERRRIEAALADARDGFDADEYARLDSEIARLKTQKAQRKTELKNARGDLQEARERVERLETIAAQRDRWKETHTQLERDITFAEAVREGVRNAGPKMRELIASRLTGRANTIYQQLRGTGRESLTVDATYLITVQDGAQTKPFGTLSGGEKMAAALAVRLAIMEQVSPIGIAVLDEPTANLDTEKKQNLVRQLERLDGFEQLTVVSHDDTFDAVTEYTVKLDKPDRETQVVADAQPGGGDD